MVWHLLPARIARQGVGNVTVCTKPEPGFRWNLAASLDQRGRVAPDHDMVIGQMRTNRDLAEALFATCGRVLAADAGRRARGGAPLLVAHKTLGDRGLALCLPLSVPLGRGGRADGKRP
jgi:hypothetical protein